MKFAKTSWKYSKMKKKKWLVKKLIVTRKTK